MTITPRLIALLVGFCALAVAPPEQNIAPKEKPDFSATALLAEKLLTLLLAPPEAPNPTSTPFQELEGFFPREPFLILKNVPKPDAYYMELTKQYAADLNVLRKRLSSVSELNLVKFNPGSCKWKAINSEYNHIAYWSCYNSQLVAISSPPTPKTVTFKIRTMINWGEKWYVTHLGRELTLKTLESKSPRRSPTQKAL